MKRKAGKSHQVGNLKMQHKKKMILQDESLKVWFKRNEHKTNVDTSDQWRLVRRWQQRNKKTLPILDLWVMHTWENIIGNLKPFISFIS